MTHTVWIESIRLISFFASVLGLYLLYNRAETQQDLGEANWNLMAFSFGYWVVNCVAYGAQEYFCADCGLIWLSIKFTGLFSLLLTFSCALALPLNQIAAKNQTEP
jgi:hypothetical protein